MKTTINESPASLHIPGFPSRREVEELQREEVESDLVDGEGTFGPPTAFPSLRTDQGEPSSHGLLAAWIGMQMP